MGASQAWLFTEDQTIIVECRLLLGALPPFSDSVQYGCGSAAGMGTVGGVGATDMKIPSFVVRDEVASATSAGACGDRLYLTS